MKISNAQISFKAVLQTQSLASADWLIKLTLTNKRTIGEVCLTRV